MSCKDHPKYAAKRPPAYECRVCWRIWYARLMKAGKPLDYISDCDPGDETK